MNRNKATTFITLCVAVGLGISAVNLNDSEKEKPIFIAASEQQAGDPAKGHDYLITGDYIKSGIAYSYYKLLNGKDPKNYLDRSGKNAGVPYSFNVVTAPQGVDVVVPNCLQCHAQVIDDSLYVGLGNSFMDFSNINETGSGLVKIASRFMQTFSPKQYSAATAFIRSGKTIFPYLQTAVQGVNAADRLAILLTAHRNPETLEWSNDPLLPIPDEVIPTDVPAWWMLKKKNAMFYNGFGRGDFGKFLMLSNMLTVKDSTEAREVSTHFGDVLAYIKTIEPPKYPNPINRELAIDGAAVFINNCSGCHGNYGSEETYPNLLIPGSIIQTDSLLYKSNYQNPQFIDWFNKSWYATSDHPANLEPSSGYVAPPLDGVWITAPYLHNGSVPTLEALLNSKTRPVYWERNFKKPEYDYENVGWKYVTKDSADSKKVYNTTLPGYGNYGHTFGDKLSEQDRKAVIEYLKTL